MGRGASAMKHLGGQAYWETLRRDGHDEKITQWSSSAANIRIILNPEPRWDGFKISNSEEEHR
jgi:hypothetical protein